MRKLRILLAHNYYRSSAPSGEDAVFENERDLLLEKGVEVVSFIRRNDDLDDSTAGRRLRLALDTSWSSTALRDLDALIRRTRPDIAHFHNTFPQISPSGYRACRNNGVPVVQTLHNFRLVCAGALLQRGGSPCEDCLNGSAILGLLPGLRHRCYRGSLPATGALTLMLARNRLNGSYRNGVDRYVALTRFAASRLQAGGLPADKFTVKPNFLPSPPSPGDGAGGYAVYVGRLSREKGVHTLLDAWSAPGLPPLHIVGDGPLRPEIEARVREQNLPVQLLGFRTRTEVLEIVRQAILQIVPSEWYEGFPMVVLEALACGTPVVASRIGSLDEIIDEDVTGSKFAPGNAGELARTVLQLIRDRGRLDRLRERSRQRFEERYSAQANFEQLLAIYRSIAPSADSAGVIPASGRGPNGTQSA